MLNAVFNDLRFRIEPDFPEVGVYLYVFDGEKCIYDYLQDDNKMCQEFAFDEFGVPLTAWTEIDL